MAKHRYSWLALLGLCFLVGYWQSVSLGKSGMKPSTVSALAMTAQAVQLGPALNLGCVNPPYTTTVFYTNTTSFNYTGGQVTLASTADGTGMIATDDEVYIEVTRPDGTTVTFSYVFGYPRNSQFVETLPPHDVTNLFAPGTNQVFIKYIDNSQCAGSSAYYLVQNTIPACPVIVAQPRSQIKLVNQNATLTVLADGVGPLQYQWYTGFSGNTKHPIKGATSNNYTPPGLTATSNYWVRISNACDYVDSNTAAIITVPAIPQPNGFDYPISNVYRPTRTQGDSDGWFVTNYFGNYLATAPCTNHIHPGDDWNRDDGRNTGEIVKAVSEGVIVSIKALINSNKQNLGQGIIIAHRLSDGSTVFSVYIHVRVSAEIQEGQVVQRGTPIATIAKIKEFNPHLHFEIRTSFIPADWYPQDDGCGYYAGLPTILSLGFIDPVEFIDQHRS